MKNKKIKVCMMARVTTAHSRGGMERHTQIVCEELAKLGVDIHLIAPSYDGKEHDIVENGVNIHYVDTKPPDSRFMWNPIWSHKAYKKFKELDKKIRFEIFHSQASGGIPFLIHDPFRKRRLKKVITLHGTIIDSFRSHLFEFIYEKSLKSLLKLLFYTFFEGAFQIILFFLYRRSDIIIATSRLQFKNIKKVYIVKEKKVKIIENGINTSLFSPKNKDEKIEKLLRKNPKEKILFWVGRMDKQKGPQIGIMGMKKIIEKIPETKLYIMGNKDGCYKELVNLTKKLSLEKNVIFLDSVKYEELPKYINACDIYIHPTLRDEAAPLVLPQAIACGKPVVASRIGGNLEVIIDGKNGLLFETGNTDDFSEKVVKLLSNDKLRERMGKEARKIALKKFSSERMGKMLLDVYKKLLNI